MIAAQHIGFMTPPGEVTVDAWRVKLFCQAIGETDPSAWAPGTPVPPTFLKALETEQAPSAALLQRMDVPLRRVLHAEQHFEHGVPVHVGDTVQIQRSIDQSYDKKDGALTFIVIGTDYSVGGRRVARSTQTILVRNPTGAGR